MKRLYNKENDMDIVEKQKQEIEILNLALQDAALALYEYGMKEYYDDSESLRKSLLESAKTTYEGLEGNDFTGFTGKLKCFVINGQHILLTNEIENINMECDTINASVDYKTNSINFEIKVTPVLDSHRQKCEIATLIEFFKSILEKINREDPCRENYIVITKLEEAVMWLNKRHSYILEYNA